MKNLLNVGILSVLLFLGGCLTTQWMRPNTTVFEYEQDFAECRYEAKIYAPRVHPPVIVGYRRNYGEAIGAAIGAGLAAGLANAIQQDEYFRACMEARGYRQEVVDPNKRR